MHTFLGALIYVACVAMLIGAEIVPVILSRKH